MEILGSGGNSDEARMKRVMHSVVVVGLTLSFTLFDGTACRRTRDD